MQTIDIIMPVHNRPRILGQAIACLAKQQMPSGWQIHCIVANDGAVPAIAEVVRQAGSFAPAWLHVEHLSLPKVGVAAARNQALVSSSSPLVLFAGGDILFRPNVVALHIDFHLQHPEVHNAALGAVKWDPLGYPTAFMEWMVHGGSQNDFDAILGSAWVDPARYFFASHLSLKRAALPANPFSVDFTGYGWEDLDLGQQLVKKGLKLYFLSQAVGLHHHHYGVDDIYARQEAIGRNFLIFQGRHKLPDAPRLTSKRKAYLGLFYMSGAAWLLKQLLKKTSATYSTPYVFNKAIASQFWKGVWKNKSKKSS
ncbi:MAG: glycosyltransferase family 2 protein [Candidatus Andersenbacteria bacterium]|nr:glycosyltransferase family 2 protein [Candidatus Andersenbacteria bacterium]